MIIHFVQTPTFLVCAVIAIALGVIIKQASGRHNSQGQRTLHVDFLRAPTSGALVSVGLLLPTLAGILAYSYQKSPGADYGSLLAAILCLMVVVILAHWHAFAMLKKGNEGDAVTLVFPADRRFITSLGLIYLLVPLALLFFAHFLVFKIDVGQAPQPESVLVQRRRMTMGTAYQEVVDAWGAPEWASPTGDRIRYGSANGWIDISLSEDRKIIGITTEGCQP